MIQAVFEPQFASWRRVARQFLARGLRPEEIHWSLRQLGFPMTENPEADRATQTPQSDSPTETNESDSPTEIRESDPPPETPGSDPSTAMRVPGEFLKLAEAVSYARDEARWDLLYRLLFRLQREPHLLKVSIDGDVARAENLRKQVKRDIHKMHAFVRFKKTSVDGQDVYVAWHRPEHLILRPAVPFFVRRFGDRRWSILTADESAHWDLQQLTFSPGVEQHEFRVQDGWDDVWKTYYKSIFNPARIKVKAMRAEMSPKYWGSMPETSLIRDLIREAPQRLQKMAKNKNQAAEVNLTLPLPELHEQAKSCQACPLYRKGTQTVFGEGPSQARILIVGEQPGDQEDLAGRPFVGPAGKILRQAMIEAGLSVDDVYLTNAVKHFKWTERGKARIHQKPNGSEVNACKPWLDAEIAQIQPQIIVVLGATAGTAILGRLPKITQERGQVRRDLAVAPAVILTWHPSAILRAVEESDRALKQKNLIEDLRLAANLIADLAPRHPKAPFLSSPR